MVTEADLDYLFLNQINNEQHKWAVCIGVLYGTNLWQVGDSSQQNGAFKIALKKQRSSSSIKRLHFIYPVTLKNITLLASVILNGWILS